MSWGVSSGWLSEKRELRGRQTMKILANTLFTVSEIGTLFCSVNTCELEICTCMMCSHAIYICISYPLGGHG